MKNPSSRLHFVTCVLLFACWGASPGFGADPAALGQVACQGDYQHHLQGVCHNGQGAIYWSFTTELVKTDRHGKVLKKIPVANHHGDLCFHAGKLFVAVNLGRFNDPQGNADSWVYVYDAETLQPLAQHETQEVFHGAGGIGVRGGHFFVVGGLPEGVQQNYVYEYDSKFRFVTRHVIKSGWTHLGIQTATFHDNAWWFGCYGAPAILLKTDAQFKMLGRFEFDASLGIMGLSRDRLSVAKGPRTAEGRNLGSLRSTHPDPKSGLKWLPQTTSATDAQRVKSQGAWVEDRFRFGAFASMMTTEANASLEYPFVGTGISVRLGGHHVPAYGEPNRGKLAIFIDGQRTRLLYPRNVPREFVLADGLKAGTHTLRVVHLADGEGVGARVESFTSWNDARGEVRWQISGEANAHLVDCRALLRRGDTLVRDTLVRNWLTGQASLTAVPPGEDYTLEIRAVGWKAVRTAPFQVKGGESINLPPIFLARDVATVMSRKSRFRFPALNQPAIRRPGETFPVRFLGFDAKIEEVKLSRQVGPAVVSRVLEFQENESAAYYYDREVVATLPEQMPAGVYDLQVKVVGGRRTGICRSPRSVHVVADYPANPTFVTFGHLDTSGQYQAEYLQRLVTLVNLLAPDMVLCSNACNPAYVSGAFAELDMPYVVNFGNHQFPGHEAWFGDPVGLVDLGPKISVLNYGYPWHVEKSTPQAEALLSTRPQASMKIINAFEANAAWELLDRHQIRLIHDAHGIGERVADFGSTPTRRVGKSNSESFRVVRFQQNQVTTCTYHGHATAPIPFPREATPPVEVQFQKPNDGTATQNVATIRNRLLDAYPAGRVVFVMPRGDYRVQGGRLEAQVTSDDEQFQIVRVRVDIPANATAEVTILPQ